MDKQSISSNSHSAASASASEDGDWLDVEADDETITVVSLLDDQTFTSIDQMLVHSKQEHDFDLVATVRRLQLDFHGGVRLINFIRDSVRNNKHLPEQISATDFEDEAYLQPVLDNDALIFSLDEVLVAGESDAQAQESAKARDLETELESVRSQFANYRLAVQETLDRRWGDDSLPAVSRSGTGVALPDERKRDTHDYYFESYAAHEIHETMLKDTVRTDAYRDFIYGNKQLFKDKIVLDIGCGTGKFHIDYMWILSMFCAKAGAAKVIAVDKSDIIVKATENIFNNGLSDKITCVKGAIEEVVLPVTQVDIIVSEWMGYCLLYEAMLPSVLYARDKYLAPGGLLAPSSVSLWMAPVADPEYVADHVSYWRDVYGFDMKAMQENIYDEVRIDHMPKASVCGEPCPFKMLDLHTIKVEDLSFTASWKSELTRDIDVLDGFLIWFDNFFATSREEPLPEPETTTGAWVQKRQGNVAFTTGPFGTMTHWRQGLLVAPPQKTDPKLAAASKLSGEVTFAALEENERALMIDTSWSVGEEAEKRSRSWKLR